MKNFRLYFFILICSLFGQSDHLLFKNIVIAPDSAEMVVIINPTNESINLDNYYLTDANSASHQYYNISSSQDHWSNNPFDFFINFPDDYIEPGDSVIIGMSTSNVFSSYYGFPCDYALANEDAINELEGDVGILVQLGSSSPLDDNRESLVLFEWDGSSNVVQDVDYFVWNVNDYDSDNPDQNMEQFQIDKTNVESYLSDTPKEDQVYQIVHSDGKSYQRKDLLELDENKLGGNGITGHDETSENLLMTWEIIDNPFIVFGCTNSMACNFNENATQSDESCIYPEEYYDCNGMCQNDENNDLICDELEDFYYNCPICVSIEDVLNGEYDYTKVTIQGMITDHFNPGGIDIIDIEDINGNRIELVISENDWSLTDSEYSDVRNSPFNRYVLRASGTVDYYLGKIQIKIVDVEDFQTENWRNYTETLTLDVQPYPFVPSAYENIEYTFHAPDYDRLIIRIFDLSGRFITTLYDGIPPFGTQTNIWNGRTHIGELVLPGTYMMHIEATGFSTGKSQTAIAPIVVGAKL